AVWPKAIVEPRIANGRRAAYFIASFLLRVEVPTDLSILRRRWIRSHRTVLLPFASRRRGTPFGVPKRVGRVVRRAFGRFGSRRGRKSEDEEGKQGAPPGRETRAPSCVTSRGDSDSLLLGLGCSGLAAHLPSVRKI